MGESKEVIDVPNLFADNTIPGTPVNNEISPYGGTALLATSINLKKEKSMVMDTFRQKYLNNEKNEGKKKIDVDLNPMREKYLKWLKSEEKRSSLSTKKVPKIASKEISDIQKQHFNEEPQTLSFE